MPTIIKLGSKLTIGVMEHEGKSIAEKPFDLKGHEGERVRVHIGNDNKYTIKIKSTQKLLICELDIPKRVYVHTKTSKKDERGEFIIETKEKKMELSIVKMKEYLKEEMMK